MIDENKDCVIKSKLVITVKALRKYNDRSRVVAKQTNKQNRFRNTETGKHLRRTTYYISRSRSRSNKRTSRRTVDMAQRQVNKK